MYFEIIAESQHLKEAIVDPSNPSFTWARI